MALGKIMHEFTVERLSYVQKWTLRTEPFAKHRNLRLAYERGFTKRTEDFNQGVRKDVIDLPASKAMTVGDAYERGYADALKQEPPSEP